MKKYKPKVPLWPHQLKALAKMKGKEAFALLLAMRTGKSAVALADFGQLELDGKVKDFLLIAPAGVYRVWLTAMREHFSDDLRERCFVHTYSSGAGKKEKEQLESFLNSKEKDPRILLINIEALSRPGPARQVCEKFLKQRENYVVIDECFPAGTMISTPSGPKKIETLRVGDIVTGSREEVKIKTVIKNTTETVVHIKTENGKLISATPSHPFFTDLGWINAEQLEGKILYEESQREFFGKKTLRILQEDIHSQQAALGNQDKFWKVLQSTLCSKMEDDAARNQSENLHRRTKQKSERKQQGPQKECRPKSLEQKHSFDNGSSAEHQGRLEKSRKKNWRRSLEWAYKATKEIVKNSWSKLGSRIADKNRQSLSPLLLSSGPWSRQKEIGNRVRWSQSRFFCSKSHRQEEGRQAQGIRVESVTVEKLTNPVTVFNLELEGTPHFFAEGVLVHNCTVIKNKSKRTDYVLKFIQPLATYRRILSGLATPRSPLDLYYQFFFLDWEILGWRSYYTFRAAVAIMATQWFGGRSVQVVVGYRDEAVAELQKLIEPASFRVPFRPDIPSTWSIREVTMTPEQKRHYNEIKEFATTALSATEHVTATVVIAQLMRMHQVLCGHVRDENGTIHTLPENKTAELIELLEDYDGKAIIWCSYDHDIRKLTDKLTEKYGEGCVARFWGGNERTREQEEVRFKSEPDCRFMLATPGAGGRGRTWVCADLVVYYSSTDNLEHRDQSEQRAMGIGKKRQVDFVDLIHPGTVEMKILEALRKKINMSSTINGDNYKSWII